MRRIWGNEECFNEVTMPVPIFDAAFDHHVAVVKLMPKIATAASTSASP